MHATLSAVSEIDRINFQLNMHADFNTLMGLESDSIEKRLSSSARERSGLPPSSDTRSHQRKHRTYNVDNGTGVTQDITFQTKNLVTSTALVGENVASINNNIEADSTPESDPKISRLWALYQTARAEYTSSPEGSFAHSKAARFLRDTIENGLTYIETVYPSLVCGGNSETCQSANLSAARNKLMELRTSLNKITPVVEKAYGCQRRRFGSELFQPKAPETEDKQHVSLTHRNRDMNTDRASESHSGAHRDSVPRDSETIAVTIREPRRSGSPRPQSLARPRIRSRSPPSSRFPPRMRSPLSSPGQYNNGYAASRDDRKFRLADGSWRRRLTARYASFPREKDRYRPTY